jgi:tetratricopeptide (TPR) repeat protein
MNNLGSLYKQSGQYEKAEPLLIESADSQRKVLGENHPEALVAQGNLGSLYMMENKLDEAEPILVDLLRRMRRVLGEDHEQTLWARNLLGGMYEKQHDYAKAEPVTLDVLKQARQRFGDSDPRTVNAMWNAANVLFAEEKYAEAQPLFAEAKRGADLLKDQSQAARAAARDGLCQAKLGRGAEAVAALRDGYDRLRSISASDKQALMRAVVSALADAYDAAGQQDEAKVWRARLSALPAPATTQAR